MAVKSCKIQYIIRIDLGIFPQVTCVKIVPFERVEICEAEAAEPLHRLFVTALRAFGSYDCSRRDVDAGEKDGWLWGAIPAGDMRPGPGMSMLQLFWIGIRIDGCHTTERFTDLWDDLETSKALWVVFISSKCFCLKWCMATQTCHKRLRGNDFLSWCFGAVSPLFVNNV